MSIHAAPPDHRAFVLFALLTHAAVGYALAVLAGRTPAVAVAAAVLPDVDLLFQPGWPFPFVHRGLLHTPLFALALVGALGWVGRRSSPTSRLAELSASAAALGYGSHLVMDSLTRSGVPWLYPLSTAGYGVDLAIHAVEHGLVIWVLAGTTLLVRRRWLD